MLTTRATFARLLPCCLIALMTVPIAGQSAPKSKKAVTENDLATAKPGRDPNQPIDEEYTKKIKQYTTETFFLSPLVDYLPASKTVPTPKAILGDIAGAEGKLPYTKEVYDYMRLLARSTPRVKVYSIGTSEEGREMLAVAVASESLIAKLDANRADLAKLADPRTIKMDDAVADEIARRAAPVYYVTGTIHSTEAGAPTALMELAYRLAVDDSLYVRNIREHVITLITPVVEPDGRDRVVDAYEWRKKHPKDTPMSPVYWGHYVAHDNNRDAMALTLKLSQNVLNTYLDWKAQVLHDLHESGSFLYDNTIGNGPYNAWLDPILTNEWHLIGWNNVNEMTRMGMPGVYAWGTFDTWSPGLPDVHGGDPQRHQPSVRDVRQQRQRRHGRADADPGRDVAHVVPAEPADRPGAMVAAQQQQLRADRPAGVAQLRREQPRLLPAQLLRQEQALDPEGEGRGPGRLRVPGQRSATRGAGRAAARPAEAGGRDIARAVFVHGQRARPAGARAGRRAGTGSAGGRGCAGCARCRRCRGCAGCAGCTRCAGCRGARVRKVQEVHKVRKVQEVHKVRKVRCRRIGKTRDRRARAAGRLRKAPRHGGPLRRGRRRGNSRQAATSSEWTSRTRGSPTRCSTISTGRRTIRRRVRTTTPAGRSRKASACRPCA